MAPWDGPSFESFIARCRHDHIPYRLSLRQLAQECQDAERGGRGLPADLRYLKGFTWFFGYLIDRKGGDIYLLGYKDPERPPIDIDCLVTAIRAVYEGKTPSCSLEAHPDPKYQKSIVLGVPWQTRWAEIMIEADYDMKKVCGGYEDPRIPEIVSWFDLSLREMQRNPNAPDQGNRWWFNRPKKDVARTLLLDKDGDFVILYRNPVVVMTEQKVDGKFGTGTIAKEAEQFSTTFTRNLPQLGKRFKSIGELLALYRLLDLVVHLKEVGDVYPPVKDYWLTGYRSPYAGPPKEVPTLSRQVSGIQATDGKSYSFGIRGGVRMPLDLDRQSIRRDDSATDLKTRLLRD
jgi:hypothetical protein